MGLFDWFESRDSKEKKTLIMNLLAVMFADGKVDDRELEFLRNVAFEIGYSQDDIQAILNNPDNIEFVVSDDPEMRIQQLVDMVLMMMADGEIDAAEMDLCMTIAARMGFNSGIIPQMVEDIAAKMREGRPRDEVDKEVEEFLNA